MPHIKATSFISKLADLMDKYDVHFVIDETEDSTNLYLIQGEWGPIDVPYDWHDGKITPEIVRNIKTV